MLLHAQSADIAQGVDAAGNKDEGAGDQGIMFGYACARRRADAGADLLRPQDPASAGRGRARPARLPQLGPDAKSQVTLRYENGKPVGVTADRASRPSISTTS